MTEAVQQHASRIPEEIARALDGLQSDEERAVFVLLFEQPGLSFTELQEELGDEDQLHPTTLSNALDDLKAGGLIRKRMGDADEETGFTSSYFISEYGERFINSLFDSLGDVHGPGGRRRSFVRPSLSLQESAGNVRKEMEDELAEL